jgi:quinone-modifying oxidoreductase, subunit QmoC
MGAVRKTVLYEQGTDRHLLDEICGSPGGAKVRDCIQCGTCSGSCPVSWAMEETPRQIFAMIRAGMKEQILDTLTIWICASCYQCANRCPQEIKVTDIMYTLKRMAIRENRKRSKKARAFAREFAGVVNRYGRSHETELMVRYMLATNPLGAMSAAPVGINLFTHGRLPLGGGRVRDIAGLRKIIAKATELGGSE